MISVVLAGLVLSLGVREPAAPDMVEREVSASKTVELEVGQSRLLEMGPAIGRVSVANPQVADVRVITPHEIQVVGVGIGETALSLWDKTDNVQVILLKITRNLSTLRSQFQDLFPGEQIQVSAAGDLVILSGEVSDVRLPKRAIEIASLHAPRVANLIRVRGNQQAQLEVRFAEVSRTGIREMGFNFYNGDAKRAAALYSAETPPGAILQKALPDTALTGTRPAAPMSGAFANAFNILFANGGSAFRFSAVLSVLEQSGLAKTLAEPTLITMSGQQAKFHAGGEVPVVTSGTLGQVAVKYKPFGVQLAFTPTVLYDDVIQLKLATEVSEVDPSVGIALPNGFSAPGFSKRKGETTIRLRDGQSFAIAGLLSDKMSSVIRKFPLLGDIPILGALFRSTEYTRKESELLVLVTVHLVQPLEPHEIPLLPGEAEVNDPDDFELFLLGKVTHWGEDEYRRPGAKEKNGPAGPMGFAE